MAGVKISNLPAATTPLTGAELVAVVQGGVTKKTTTAAITPTLTGPVTSVGNTTTIVGPLPAITLAGTLSGGGNQVNNVVIGATTPLAGSFTQVTASTKILVGVTSSVGAQGLQVYGLATTGAQNIVQRAYSDTTGGANLLLLKTRGTTATSTDAVQSGDTLGSVTFLGSDGAANQARAAITGYCDGAVSAGVVPTAITFTTGTSVGTQRAVFTSAGLMGIGTGTPASCAIVDVTSTTLGFKFPVMTTTQKNAIGTPVAGLVIFDTTLAKLCVYSGSAWQTITSV